MDTLKLTGEEPFSVRESLSLWFRLQLRLKRPLLSKAFGASSSRSVVGRQGQAAAPRPLRASKANKVTPNSCIFAFSAQTSTRELSCYLTTGNKVTFGKTSIYSGHALYGGLTFCIE